jgi:hypothetical protein
MGTFGTAIFSDDFACDIRDEFKELLGEGMSSEEATKFLIENNDEAESSEDEASVFWLSLAAVQWQTGRLLEEVKQKAIEVIDTDADLKRWELEGDERLVTKRKKELIKLKEKLLSPQPQQKKIAKVYREFTPFEIGDVFSYAHSSGKFALFRVIGHFQDNGGRKPICELLDFFNTTIPTDKDSLEKMAFITLHQKDFLGRNKSTFLLGDIKQKYEPKEKVKLIARNVNIMQDAKRPSYHIFWRDLDESIPELFASKISSK